MSRTHSIMWDMFTETGNIEVYLRYKEHCRVKELKEVEKCQNKQLKQTQ